MTQAAESGEIVLVTGGSGFLGQHLIKMLLDEKQQLGIREVRSVDLLPFRNQIIEQAKAAEVRSFIGDICKPDTVREAFVGVGTVFHCAANLKIEYPPNHDELEQINVGGSRAVVELCVENNVSRLVHTSCASVCVVPFKGSTFTIVINQTESKALTPEYNAQDTRDFDGCFLIPGYSSSKLRGEKIVLNSNGALLANQKDYLQTVALRPPLMYGECDTHFVPNVFSYLSKHGYVYPRVAGAGGKQQLAYAGNVAYAHICAYKTLKTRAKAIAGLPVFVTDDTPINDVTRFVQKMALLGQQFKVKLTFWYLPHFLFFFLGFLIELLARLLYPVTKKRLPFSLRAIASFTASVLMFNRLRASIHMDYTPLIESDLAMQRSATWYAKWWLENIKNKRSQPTK